MNWRKHATSPVNQLGAVQVTMLTGLKLKEVMSDGCCPNVSDEDSGLDLCSSCLGCCTHPHPHRTCTRTPTRAPAPAPAPAPTRAPNAHPRIHNLIPHPRCACTYPPTPSTQTHTRRWRERINHPSTQIRTRYGELHDFVHWSQLIVFPSLRLADNR